MKNFEDLFNQIEKNIKKDIPFDKEDFLNKAQKITTNQKRQERRNTHDTAKALFVYENKTLYEIAKILGTNTTTLSRMKVSSVDDWEYERKMFHVEKYDTTKVLRQSINAIIDTVSKTKLSNGSYADKLAKLAKTYRTVTFQDSKTGVKESVKMFCEFLKEKRNIDVSEHIKDFIYNEFYVKDY